MLAAVACARDIPGENVPAAEEPSLRFSLMLSKPRYVNPFAAGTRAEGIATDAERQVRDVKIWVFDDRGELVSRLSDFEFKADGGATTLTAVPGWLRVHRNQTVHAYFVANLPEDSSLPDRAGESNEEQFRKLATDAANGVIGTPLVMVATADFTITEGKHEQAVTLRRVAARFDIVVKELPSLNIEKVEISGVRPSGPVWGTAPIDGGDRPFIEVEGLAAPSQPDYRIPSAFYLYPTTLGRNGADVDHTRIVVLARNRAGDRLVLPVTVPERETLPAIEPNKRYVLTLTADGIAETDLALGFKLAVSDFDDDPTEIHFGLEEK